MAYESQLKADRAELHRQLAAAIQQRDLDSVEGNAGMIAEHLESAGDLHEAFNWHIAPARGSPTAISPERGAVGRGRNRSQTD